MNPFKNSIRYVQYKVQYRVQYRGARKEKIEDVRTMPKHNQATISAMLFVL